MTLTAAVRAEVFKLGRNRVALWWAFWLVPIVLFVFAVALEGLMPVGSPQLRGLETSQPVRQAAASLGSSGNPLIQLFYAIGAAGLFAGEYRWETWRLIATRNSRLNLVVGKFATYVLFSAASLALIGLGGFVAAFYGPLAHGMPIVWPAGPTAAAGDLVMGFVAGILSLTAVGAMAALGAVVTRSMLGGVVPTLLLGFVQAVLTGYLAMPSALHWKLLIPQFAAAAVRGWGQTLGDDPAKAWLGAAGAICLIGWTVALVLLAAAIFRRQDLARE